MIRLQTRSAGFSLVELMVSMLLGLVLLAGVARVFLDSKQGYRVQESASRLQENSRFAIEYLNRYIRVADFWGGTPAGSLFTAAGATVDDSTFTWPGPSGATTCRDGWLISPDTGIRGYTGGKTVPGAFDCIKAADYVPQSDVLVLRSANPDSYVDTAHLSCGSKPNNGPFYIKTLAGQKSVMFNVTKAADCAAAKDRLPGAGINGVMNYQYQFSAFFIRPCSTKGGAPNCNSDSDHGHPIPTLAMVDLTTTGVRQDSLVEGVEMLKFEYGVDAVNLPLQSVTGYVAADKLSDADWSRVLSVRASLIVRGDALDSYDDSKSQYQMTSDYVFAPGTYYSGDPEFTALMHYQRRQIVKEIQLRNRVRQ